jgi:hypothetical protein
MLTKDIRGYDQLTFADIWKTNMRKVERMVLSTLVENGIRVRFFHLRTEEQVVDMRVVCEWMT